MSTPSFHRQCRLRKGATEQVTFIPEEFAKVGRFVKLRSATEWDDGWKVVAVYSRVESREAAERSQDYKHQRRASDI